MADAVRAANRRASTTYGRRRSMTASLPSGTAEIIESDVLPGGPKSPEADVLPRLVILFDPLFFQALQYLSGSVSSWKKKNADWNGREIDRIRRYVLHPVEQL